MNESTYTVYAYVPPTKFDPKDYLVAEANERDILEYKEIFDFMDSNNNGSIQPMDLRKSMLKSGYNPKKEFIYHIMADFDQDESGIIEFREFVKMMTIRPSEQDTDDDILKIFNHMDMDGDGLISFEDLKEYQEEHKEDMSDEQLKEMIRICDRTGGGFIRPNAFVKFQKNHEGHIKD